MAAKFSKAELVTLVRAHAANNYETGGWDYVVEAWGDDDIAEAIGRATTEAGAIAKVAAVVGVINDVRADVIAAGGGEPY